MLDEESRYAHRSFLLAVVQFVWLSGVSIGRRHQVRCEPVCCFVVPLARRDPFSVAVARCSSSIRIALRKPVQGSLHRWMGNGKRRPSIPYLPLPLS